MLNKNIYNFIIFFSYIIILFSFTNSQSSTEELNLLQYYCSFGKLKINESINNTITDDFLNSIIISNLDDITENSLLMLYEEEFQIFIFRNSRCTYQFQYDVILDEFLNNKLHLFSIEGKIESNINIIKLVIQTKKEFQIFLYDNKTRIYNISNDEVDFNIKTNLYHYFENKFYYYEEFELFKNNNINIFNDSEKIFNDICYKFETYNINNLPELRKSLYYFKNDNLTYPLLSSNYNCYIFKSTISYKNESFILEYKCKKNINIFPNNIQIKEISIVNKEDIITYKEPKSLKDQKNLLKCYKEAFKKKNIKNNIGFYISLFLIIIEIIATIILFIQKYEIKLEEESTLEAPPKKKSLKETLKEKRDKKKKNDINDDEIIYEENKKKKKRKKKKQINNSDNEEDYKEKNNKNLNWYTNKNVSDEEKEKNDIYNYSKPKKKKKKGKRKLIDIKIEQEKNDNYLINNSFENKNDQDSDFKFRYEENDIKNKTISKFPNAYNKFQNNTANKLKEKINLRRLVIFTNLGNDINKIENFNNNTNKLKIENKKDINSFIQDDDSNMANLKYNNNNLFNTKKEEQNKNDEINKLGIIIGTEDNSFINNILRDYLSFEQAINFDKRNFFHNLCHIMKLKNDFINIFLFNYSFVPFTIRLIKFFFFFHFMFYLETLCIGRKYYFNKFYSEEFQEFLTDNYLYENDNILSNSTDEYNNDLIAKTFKHNKNIELNKFNKFHFLYLFKHAFPRVLIPAAISLISYIFTSVLSPRRKIIKIILNTNYNPRDKFFRIRKITETYEKIYIFISILALFLMIFFFYSLVNYFYVFEEAKYDITQSFLLSGLIRFVFDIIILTIIIGLRYCSIKLHKRKFYNIVTKLYEIN